jgi:hypothetical protein
MRIRQKKRQQSNQNLISENLKSLKLSENPKRLRNLPQLKLRRQENNQPQQLLQQLMQKNLTQRKKKKRRKIHFLLMS